MLLAVEIFHTVACALVVAKGGFILVLVELGLVAPQLALEDIYYGFKIRSKLEDS